MKKVLAGAVVVAIGGLLALVLMDGGSEQEQLTAKERADARRVALGSEDLKRILGGLQYSVKSIGKRDPVVEARSHGLLDDLIIVELGVRPPETVRAQWAYVGELEPCERHWVPLTVKDLRTVYVFVDLSKSQAAAIVPSESKGLADWKVPARTDNTCS